MSSRVHSGQPQSHRDAQHARVANLLAEYVTLQSNGRALGGEWRELEDHVQHCAICSEDLVALRSLLLDTATGQLAHAEQYPEADLSFLQERDSQTIDLQDLRRVVRNAFIQFSEALVAQLQMPLLAGAMRGQRAHYAASQEPPTPAVGWSYAAPPAAESELRIVIEVEPIQLAPSCRVLVTVDDPADPIPQIESDVTLQHEHIARTVRTDRGTVAFSDVPLDAIAQMRITVVKHSTSG